MMPDQLPPLMASVGPDAFELFDHGRPRGEKVVELLRYSKKDVAHAAGVPISSIRYDSRIPHELEERLLEWANALNLVAGFFGGDLNKTLLWFRAPNPSLGYI